MHTPLLGGALLAWMSMVCACGAEPLYVVKIQGRQFVPQQTELPSGVKLRIVLENQDDIAEEFGSPPLHRTAVLAPGSRVTLSIGPLDPGRYLFRTANSTERGSCALGVFVVR